MGLEELKKINIGKLINTKDLDFLINKLITKGVDVHKVLELIRDLGVNLQDASSFIIFKTIQTAVEEGDIKALELLLESNIDKNKVMTIIGTVVLFDVGDKNTAMKIINWVKGLSNEYKEAFILGLTDDEDEFMAKIGDFGKDFLEAVREIAKDAGLEDLIKDELSEELLNAVVHNNIGLVKALLDQGVDVNYKNPFNGKTPLHAAVQIGSLKIIKLLLENGADVNARDEDKNTPLHYAAKQGNEETAKLLIKAGADVNAKNVSGKTPLHKAAKSGYEGIVKALLENGANPCIKDNGGRTPFDIAYIPEIESLLREAMRKAGCPPPSE